MGTNYCTPHHPLARHPVTHTANGAPTPLKNVQILDGGAIRTLTFPADLSNYVGQEIIFVAKGTARAHVITGTAGQLGGSQTYTFAGTNAREYLRVYVEAADYVAVIGDDGGGTYS